MQQKNESSFMNKIWKNLEIRSEILLPTFKKFLQTCPQQRFSKINDLKNHNPLMIFFSLLPSSLKFFYKGKKTFESIIFHHHFIFSPWKTI